MDLNSIVELVPHWIAMLVLVFLALAALDALVGGTRWWIEFAIIVVVVALYRPIVVRLGVAPSSWEE